MNSAAMNTGVEELVLSNVEHRSHGLSTLSDEA
jgi:hypothetical protein